MLASSDELRPAGRPRLRVVFMGTPEFSVPCFQHVLGCEAFEVVGVFTQPDRPAGRGQKLTPPPVKQALAASGRDIPLFQPERLSRDEDAIAWLTAQRPDFLVTIAFGQILPQRVLDIPRFGVVNVHASLLPHYRGANPILWAIRNGDPVTGLTTMLTVKEVDAGAILLAETLPIPPSADTGTLTQQLSHLAGPLLERTLVAYAQGDVWPQPQPHHLATHAPKLAKDDAWVDWSLPAATLHRYIRSQHPWPGSVTLMGDKRMKLFQPVMEAPSEIVQLSKDYVKKDAPPGTLLRIIKRDDTSDGSLGVLWVLAGDGAPIGFRSLQLEGKPLQTVPQWAQACGLPLSTDLGDACFAPAPPADTPAEKAS